MKIKKKKLKSTTIKSVPVVLAELCRHLSDIKYGDDSNLRNFRLSRIKTSTAGSVLGEIKGIGTSWYELGEKASEKKKKPLTLRALYSITRGITPSQFKEMFGTNALYAIDTILTNDSLRNKVQAPFRELSLSGLPVTKPRAFENRGSTGMCPGAMACYRHILGVFVEDDSFKWVSVDPSNFSVVTSTKFIHWSDITVLKSASF